MSAGALPVVAGLPTYYLDPVGLNPDNLVNGTYRRSDGYDVAGQVFLRLVDATGNVVAEGTSYGGGFCLGTSSPLSRVGYALDIAASDPYVFRGSVGPDDWDEWIHGGVWGGFSSHVSLVLPVAGVISGRVIDASGSGISDVRVYTTEFKSRNAGVGTYTLAEGDFLAPKQNPADGCVLMFKKSGLSEHLLPRCVGLGGM